MFVGSMQFRFDETSVMARHMFGEQLRPGFSLNRCFSLETIYKILIENLTFGPQELIEPTAYDSIG